MPSTEPPAGPAPVSVGSEAVSVPAWNDHCCHTVAAMATSAHAYSSGVRSTAHIPSPSRSTTPLVSTENRPAPRFGGHRERRRPGALIFDQAARPTRGGRAAPPRPTNQGGTTEHEGNHWQLLLPILIAVI